MLPQYDRIGVPVQNDYRFTDTRFGKKFWGEILQDTKTGVFLRMAFFSLYASLLLLLCTKNSPLYVFNDLPDPNIYMDVGRAVSKGAVLYRDVFEQKGPLFLLVISLLSRIAPYSMNGMYIWQCIALAVSLGYLFRTARLYISGKAGFIICLLFPILMLNKLTYWQAGGSAEEFLLPVFVGGLYFLLRYFNTAPDRTETAGRNVLSDFFFQGVFSCIVILTKISLSVFFMAGCGMIFLHLLYTRKFAFFFRAAALYLLGLFTASLPCLLYFAATDSFTDFWNMYILFNMKYASDQIYTYSFTDTGLALFMMNFFSSIMILFGFAAIFLGRFRIAKFGKAAVSLACAALVCIINFSGRPYNYTFIPLLSFAGVGLIGTYLMMQRYYDNKRNKVSADYNVKRIKLPVLLMLGCIIAVTAASNTWVLDSKLLRADKTGIEQIADCISTSWTPAETDRDPCILMYDCYDIGLYDLVNTTPQVKVFQTPIISYELFPDILNTQTDYIRKGVPDYVVTMGFAGQGYQQGFVEEINRQYAVIDCVRSTGASDAMYLTLYKKMA